MIAIAIISAVCLLSSCSQDEGIVPDPPPTLEAVMSEMSDLDSMTVTTRATVTPYYGIEIVGNLPFTEPTHGIPNVTTYHFFVANPDPSVTEVDLIITAPNEQRFGYHMSKNPAGNFSYKMTLPQHGRYEVEYRPIKGTKFSIEIPIPSYVDNTYVNFSGSVKKLVWPFGADGSTYTYQGNWYISCGHGCNQHTGGEYYSLDWTKIGGSNNAVVKSPLDGKVVRKRFHADGGNQIGIEQTIGNVTYAFQIGHLQSLLPSINVGDYVQAGVTIIGYIGSTGNVTGPHAHTTLRSGSITGTSVNFDFSAKP